MKRIYLILILIFTSLTLSSISAQTIVKSRKSTSEENKKEVKSKFWDKYWVGGNVQLGFVSNGQESYFGIGLAPMLGYKITENFSAGPRIVYNYGYRKIQLNNIVKFNEHEFGAGVFSRYKFFDMFFVHAESDIIIKPDVYYTNGDIDYEWQPTLYLGLGYNRYNSEIYILYDFLRDTEDTIDIPIEFRIGYTFNF